MLEHEVLGYSSKSMAQTGYKEKLQEVKIHYLHSLSDHRTFCVTKNGTGLGKRLHASGGHI